MSETVEVIFRESGSKQVSDGAKNIGTESEKAAAHVTTLNSAIGKLQTVLAAVGLAAGVKQVLDLSEAYELTINKLRLYSDSTQDLAAKEQALYDIALRTRQGFDDVAASYAGLDKASRGLGLSQQDVLDITETVAKATTASGKSAEETAGAMKRLGLALASGHTDARLFMTLFQQFPALANALASSLNLSIPAFRNMLSTGQISTKQIVDGLKAAGAEGTNLSNKFNATEITVSGAFRNIATAVEVYIGRSTASSGITTALAKALNTLATNMQVIGPVLVALSIGITTLGVAMLTTSTYAAALYTAIGANKWGLIISAVTAVISLFISFGDKIKLTSDGSVTALSAVVGVFKLLGTAIQFTAGLIASFYDAVKNGNPAAVAAATALTVLTLGFSRLALTVTVGFFAGIIGGLAGMAVNLGLLVVAIAPVIAEMTAFVAVFAAGAVLMTKFTDATGVTTGAFDRLQKAVVDIGNTIKTGVTDAVTNASAAMIKAGQDGLNMGNSIADGANTGAKAITKLQESINKFNEEADASLKKYQESVKTAQDAYNKSTEELIKRVHDRQDADEQASKSIQNNNAQTGQSYEDMGKKSYDEANKEITADRARAQAAKDAADEIITANNAAANSNPFGNFNGPNGSFSGQMGGVKINGLQNDITVGMQIVQHQNELDKGRLAILQASGGAADAISQLTRTIAEREAQLAAANFGTYEQNEKVFGAGAVNRSYGGGLGNYSTNYGSKFDDVHHFAGGGSFKVGGNGGTDSQMVQFMASPDERVTVQTPAQQRASDAANSSGRPVVVHMHIQTPDVEGFKRSHRTIATSLSSRISRVNMSGT
jgi:tape measure domain-containing protein